MAIVIGGADGAFGDPSEGDTGSEESRWSDWIPAVGLTGTFTAQNQDSAVSSSCDHGGPGSAILAPCTQGIVEPGVDPRTGPPTFFADPSPLRDPADGSDLTLWPSVGIDLQLASPAIVELPYEINPRIFFGASLTASFPPTRTIATEGNVGVVEEPETRTPSVGISTIALEGVGSETESVPQTLEYSAHVGFAIPLQYRGRTINIKPSFGWARWSLDVTGRVHAGIKDDVNGISGSNSTPFGSNLRAIYLEDEKVLNVDGIGPGIEVEYISGQFGDLGAAVFVSAHAYKVLGDRKVELQDAVTFPGGGPGVVNPDDLLLEDTYRAQWEHEIDPWFYRLRLGIRVHYNPQ